MAVPVLVQGPYLIASVQDALTDADLVDLRTNLLEQVGKRRCRGVVVDVTALDVMDSFATRTLRGVAAMLALRGAETVIVGIQPAVAISMIQLGLSMPNVVTAVDLDEGLALLSAGRSSRVGRG